MIPGEVLRSTAALNDALADLIDKGMTGIVLRGPGLVAPGGKSLQIAGCSVETLREAAGRPAFENMAVLVGAQVETGRVRAVRAFAGSSEGARRSPSDPGEGYTGRVFRIDVAARLGIPLVPGAIAVWVLSRDRAAGPERIMVAGPPARGTDDPEVARFLAAWKKRNVVKPRGADPATVWPEQTVFGKYPVYRQTPESPPMPGNGIALGTPGKVVTEKRGVWPLSGSFRLKIPARHVVREPLSGNPAAAVVPITLVITGNEIAGPIMRHLRVPSYSPIDTGDPAPVVEGRFNINMFSFSIVWRAPHTYFVYAVCGDVMSAPVATALAAPLPPGEADA